MTAVLIVASKTTKCHSSTLRSSHIISASCFCGAVQYELSAAPMFIHACHCADCQVQTGGAFAINGIIEAEHVRLTRGKPVRVTMPTESGRPHDIYRCAKCQTAKLQMANSFLPPFTGVIATASSRTAKRWRKVWRFYAPSVWRRSSNSALSISPRA